MSKREITFEEAINEGICQEMEKDESVFIYGIGVPDHKKVFGTTKNIVEKFGFRIVEEAIKRVGHRNVAFAGGVALNSVMNGKIANSNLIDDMFIQPNAGDGGTALGAALVTYQRMGYKIPNQQFNHAYWGLGYNNGQIKDILDNCRIKYEEYPDGITEKSAYPSGGERNHRVRQDSQ